jgi:hypothetical protein
MPSSNESSGIPPDPSQDGAILDANLHVSCRTTVRSPLPTVAVQNAGPHYALLTGAVLVPDGAEPEAATPLVPTDGGFPVSLPPGSAQLLRPPGDVLGRATVEVVCHDGRGRRLDRFEIDLSERPVPGSA